MPRHPLFLLVSAALPAFAETTLAPITVNVLSPETTIPQAALEKQAAKDTKALFDNMPGVNFSETMNGQPGDIEIRGMGGMGGMFATAANRVGMEVDGMDVGQSFTFGHNISNGRQYFDTADLKAVEVRKGPGSGSLAGKVRFRTKDPEDYLQEGRTFGGEARAGYSGDSNDYMLGATIAAQPNSQHGLSVSYTHRWFDELNNKGGLDVDGKTRSKRNPLDGQSNALNGKWVFSPDQAHRFITTIQHFDVKSDTLLRDQIGTVNRRGVLTNTASNTQRNQRDALSLRHELNVATPAFDHANWQISAQRTVSKGRNFSIRTQEGKATTSHDNNDFKVNTFSLTSDAEKTFDGHVSHTLAYGFKLQYSEADLDGQIISASGVKNREFFPKSEQWQGTLHAADRMDFGQSGVSLTPSLNLNHIHIDPKLDSGVPAAEGTKKYSKTAVGGGVRLDWQANDQHLFSASYHHATRMPAFGETNGQNYGHWIGKPNPNLKPETADGLELAWNSQGALGEQRTTLFYNHYTDMIDIKCGPGFETGDACEVFNEKGNSKVYGIEFDGRLALDAFGLPQGLSAEGGVAWAKGKNGQNEPIARVDPLSGFVGLRYTHPEDIWGVATRLKFSAAKKSGDLPGKVSLGESAYKPLPGYGSVDITGHYKPLQNFTISGGIYNVLDKKYARWSRARQHNGNFTSYSEAGRYVGVNFRYQF